MTTNDQVVLVTGSSRGLGRVFAQQLVGAGYRVACLARPSDELDELVTTLGPRALAVPADLGNSAQVTQALQTAVDTWGRLDVVVNNAAFFEPRLLADISDELVEKHIAVNLLGPVWTTRAAIPHFRANGTGHVVFISSESVQRPFPMLSLYAATKAAVETLSAALRDELRAEQIKVSTLRVGTFRGGTGASQWPADVREAFLTHIAATGHAAFAGGQADPVSLATALVQVISLPPDVNADIVEVRSTLGLTSGG